MRTRNRSIGSRISRLLVISLGLSLLLSGCASQGDFLRLQQQVRSSQQANRGSEAFARIAKISAEVDTLRTQVSDLEGELEIARKETADAMVEIQKARVALAQQSARQNPFRPPGVQSPPLGPNGQPSGPTDSQGRPLAPGATISSEPIPPGQAAPAPQARVQPPPTPAPRVDRELARYQDALEARRADNYSSCIKRFTSFLQSYPASGYADDAAYWLADCTYNNQEFKRAVIRFSDVVRVYPESPKAPDALYRQGESLLKLGPRFSDAARTVFKRVQKDYPDSPRSPEAAGQLKRLGPGADG